MKRLYEAGLAAACLWGCVGLVPFSAWGVTRYVDAYSASPIEPYTDPNHGASSLQAAVDVCWSGDEVLVFPGVYDQGGRVVEGQQVTNRLVLTNGVTVRSVEGEADTVIVGQIPVGVSGIRCVYMSPGSKLVGFTVTRGSTRTGEGGGWSPDYSGGGIFMEGGGIVSNCTVFTNTASFGGGIFCSSGEVVNCRIVTNQAVYTPGSGGGVYCAPGGRIRQCTIQGNRGRYGAGAFCDKGGLMEACVIRQNRSARNAGGLFCASNALVKNCQISGNNAYNNGGGVYAWQGGDLRNVLVLTNTASQGGGSFLDRGGLLESCTVSRNSGTTAGGGLYTWSTGEVWNTIIYQNNSVFGSNHAATGSGPFFGYSCLAPLPTTNTTACFSTNPSFEHQGSYRLNVSSPCIDKGTNQSWMLFALDNDLRPRIWVNRVDVGALERNPVNTLEDTDNDGIPDYWEWQYFGHVTGLPPSFDGDGDLYDAYSEFIAGTDPTSASSFFAISGTRKLQTNNVLTWPSVAGRYYTLYRTTNLLNQAGNVLLAVDLPATPPLNAYTDTVMNAQCGIYILHVRKP